MVSSLVSFQERYVRKPKKLLKWLILMEKIFISSERLEKCFGKIWLMRIFKFMSQNSTE